ncbi:efflux RND transporter permease subunit [Desulforhopalus sp. IMCC35007]|uniref:efflux RND transporter permease subunit n=1 Tax=Desulforhopalus sp. IMCC35007 TaxID=2569543 RepID=UPI001F0F8529|nr:efflux RND transporter permease subunit [Desulforhopalus sp. IMCC35007]
MSTTESPHNNGPITWMIHNRVTPNLLMLILMIGGIFMSSKITREVFPAFELDNITISVSYPGASPEEVEQGIILAVEEAIQGIEGVKEITATANEGSASIVAELSDEADPQKLMQDIQQEVDRITTFPEDAEDPTISIAAIKRQVLQLNIYGDVPEKTLRKAAEDVRDQLLQEDGITQIDLRGVRDYEIEISIPTDTLRKYNLSIASVAASIAKSSVEIPGGKLETSGGEILLRVKNKSEWAKEFARIPIISSKDGTMLFLEDIATVRDGFEDSSRFGTFNNQPSIQLYVYRVGQETPIGVSDVTHKAMEEIQNTIPPDIHWAISSDRSDVYKQRLQLLLKNAYAGLFLVLLLLGLFLEMRLAFWVTMGIPISFLGALLFLPFFDVSINMISMFAFIIALGIVVDDAIIAGENIYEYRQRGMNYLDAAIEGAKDVAIPITFSILTNIIAFLPMAFVPGVMGKVWRVIPVVVIVVFLISWVESLYILPSHLAHSKENGKGSIAGSIHRFQQKFANLLLRFIYNVYGPVLDRILSVRYLAVVVLMAVLVVTIAYVKSGRIRMILSPRVESDRAVVTATLPYGSPLSEMVRVRERLIAGIDEVAKNNGGTDLLDGTFALIDDNEVEVNAYLTSPDIRPLSTGDVTQAWRKATGSIIGLSSIRYESDRGGPGGGAAIAIELRHRDSHILDEASIILAEKLEEFSSSKDVDSGYSAGKIQFNYQVNPWGESLGLTSSEIGRQIRNSFQGAIALRQQRGNNEVTVRIRLPKEERSNQYSLENLLILTPASTYVPLAEVATLEKSRAYTTIARNNARRTITVSANVDPIGDSPIIIATLDETILPELAQKFPGLSYGYSGREADRKESVGKLLFGFLFALGGIYFLLAIPFRSYIQPIVVMIAIPFGIIGAVFGHMIMNYNLSLMSMMGVVALSGVVVNDSLVLVDYANKQKRKGTHSFEAIKTAGLRRFRPVMLTTLTTFGGLAPMIFETSRQARFMIPMAISLGFGILFATIVTLALVPCLYLIIDDCKKSVARLF